MKKSFLVLTFIPVLIMVSCKKETIEPGMKNIELTAVQKSLLKAGNKFAFQLLQQVDQSEGEKDRYFISPYSAAEALSMTLNGAAGATADSMKMVLGYYDMDSTSINEYCKTLRNTLLRLDSRVQLSIANSIWYKTGFEVLPSFVQVNRDYFDAAVSALDFSNAASKDIINNWIEDKTNGRIKDMIEEIEPSTVMFLVNALWFKAQWQSRFDEKLTTLNSFTCNDGGHVQASTMTQTHTFQYYENDLMQLIELPYGQGNFAMNILLPAEGKNINELLLSLNEESWTEWISRMQINNIQLFMPRLKFDYEVIMNDILRNMGMGITFESMADFTGIRASGGLCISKVQQNTFLEVNEKGSEAAAVTIVDIRETSAGNEPSSVVFNADHPYLFFITERSTGAIIFAGRINKPIY